MTNAKHTPGPWIVSENDCAADNSAERVIRGERCAPIAKVFDDGRGYEATKEYEANARLIAAAPELLAALEQIEANAGMYHTETIAEIARAAIAKAKGE